MSVSGRSVLGSRSLEQSKSPRFKPLVIVTEENVSDDHDIMCELCQKLPDCEDFIGWLDANEEALRDSDILNLAMVDIMEENDSTNDEAVELRKISHDEGRQVLERLSNI
ncbi:hypothetical protein Trydic_g20938 [Trypoxylus dichotomus]